MSFPLSKRTVVVVISALVVILGLTPGLLAGEFIGDHVRAMGDADLDGDVDLGDFVILKRNFGRGTTWGEGDFTDDGVVDLDDFGILKQFFGTRTPQSKALPADHTFAFTNFKAPVETDPNDLADGFTLLEGITVANSDNGTLYMRFSDRITGFRVQFFSDASRRSLVAHTANFTTPGIYGVASDNGSGVMGRIIVTALPAGGPGTGNDDSVSATWLSYDFPFNRNPDNETRIEESTEYAQFGSTSMKVTGETSEGEVISLELTRFEGEDTIDLSCHSLRFAYYVENDAYMTTIATGSGGVMLYFYDSDDRSARLAGMPIIPGRHHVIDFTTSQCQLFNQSFDWSSVKEIELFVTGDMTPAAWSDTTIYYVGWLVSHGGRNWRCLAWHNIYGLADEAIEPGTDETVWEEVDRDDRPILHINLLESRPNKTTPGVGYIIVHEDDCVANAYPTLMRMAGEIGIKVGLAVPPTRIGTEGYMTWTQINNLFHTGNVRLYPHLKAMPICTDEPAQRSYMREVATLIGNLAAEQGEPFGNPNMYIIPQGTCGGICIPRHIDDYNIMLEYVGHIRGTAPFWSGTKFGPTLGGGLGSSIYTTGTIPPEPVDPRWSWSMQCNHYDVGTAGRTNSTKWITTNGIIARAISDGTVATLYFHGVGSLIPGEPTYHVLNNLTDDTAAAFCDFLEEKVNAGVLVPIWTEDLYR